MMDSSKEISELENGFLFVFSPKIIRAIGCFFKMIGSIKDFSLNLQQISLNNGFEINSHVQLKCIQDISNGFKHKELTNPKIDSHISIVREYDYFAAEINPKTTPIRHYVGVAKEKGELEKIDLFELINYSYNEWNKFLLRNNML